MPFAGVRSQILRDWVTNSAGAGRGFFMRRGSRILRGCWGDTARSSAVSWTGSGQGAPNRRRADSEAGIPEMRRWFSVTTGNSAETINGPAPVSVRPTHSPKAKVRWTDLS
jgi:hypothetical protein